MSLPETSPGRPATAAKKPALSWERLLLLTLAGLILPPVLSVAAVFVTGAKPFSGFGNGFDTNTPFQSMVLFLTMLCWTVVPLLVAVAASIYGLIGARRIRGYLVVPAFVAVLGLLAFGGWALLLAR